MKPIRLKSSATLLCLRRAAARVAEPARWAILCLTIVFSTGNWLFAEDIQRPNVIVIVTDDQGWGDLSCHGNPVLETPALDAMAKRGAEFSRFYVSPVCSPTRACLMTGRYNYRTRVTDTFRGHSMMDSDELTVAELLRAAGYATGIFGKWHLGDCYPMRPQDQGFDRAVVFRGGGLAQPSEPLENQRRYTNSILWRNGAQFESTGYCTDVYFDEAQQFIAEEVSSARPFFAYIAPNAPHGPYHDVPKSLYEKYKARDLTPVLMGRDQNADTVARVYAMVENIDQNVGRLFAFLKRLQIADNTLVFFMSDNGPETPRFNGLLRGVKTEVFEGGVRSPCFVEWPRHVKPGTRIDCIAAHIDVLPTILDAAEVALPSQTRIDGYSLLPLLTGKDFGLNDRMLFLQSHRGGQPFAGHNVAVIGQKWKLVRPSGFQYFEPIQQTVNELYDLEGDSQETCNVASQRREIAAELLRAYDEWFEDVSSTRVDNFEPPRVVVGAEAEPETVLTWQDWQTDGPNWGEQGLWLIHAPESIAVRATVILKDAAAGKARLSINETSHQQDIAHAQRRVVFDQIELPAGDLTIGFALRNGQDAVAPYQIILTRQ